MYWCSYFSIWCKIDPREESLIEKFTYYKLKNPFHTNKLACLHKYVTPKLTAFSKIKLKLNLKKVELKYFSQIV